MHAEFGKAMDNDGGGYGIAVLSRWPIVNASTHPLPEAPEREPRAALTVRVKAGGRGPLLRFTSTHLDQGREPESRFAQAAALNELLIGDGLPAILAGDMNARRDTDVMLALEAEWTNASIVDPGSADPNVRPRSRGDHVLVGPAARWRIVEWNVIDETLASDHRPILVVLELLGGR
jgi:endonuclease/exonuclease/phosphatase family metal-dependent hydrolase